MELIHVNCTSKYAKKKILTMNNQNHNKLVNSLTNYNNKSKLIII